jgi:transcriptional regulator with XRE-family HTH domain
MKALPRSLAGAREGDRLGTRLRQARESKGYTIKRAAELVGISPGQLGRIERGLVQMVADASTLRRAASAYSVSDVWLYAGDHAGQRFVPDWYSPDARA